jgi:surfeit locus 1 family protein
VNRDRKFYRVTAAAVFFSLLGLVLGFWQLDRAAQKEALQSAMYAQAGKTPLANAEVIALAAQGRMQESGVLYHPVRLSGHWLPEHTLYLDNRQMDAKVGFFVFTPLRLDPQGQVLMVQRGWVPRNFEAREQLPEVQTPVGLVAIDGDIALAPSKLYAPGAPSEGSIRQNLDLDQFRSQTGLPLQAFTVREVGPPSQGLRRQWPVIHFGIEKHYGYAFQWFALSLLIAGLYLWLQFFRRPADTSRDMANHGPQ